MRGGGGVRAGPDLSGSIALCTSCTSPSIGHNTLTHIFRLLQSSLLSVGLVMVGVWVDGGGGFVRVESVCGHVGRVGVRGSVIYLG